MIQVGVPIYTAGVVSAGQATRENRPSCQNSNSSSGFYSCILVWLSTIFTVVFLVCGRTDQYKTEFINTPCEEAKKKCYIDYCIESLNLTCQTEICVNQSAQKCKDGKDCSQIAIECNNEPLIQFRLKKWREANLLSYDEKINKYIIGETVYDSYGFIDWKCPFWLILCCTSFGTYEIYMRINDSK